MNANPSVQADERTGAVAQMANTWGLNFISFALLIDIMYRGLFLNEAAWDLFAVLGLTGVITTIYLARHQVLGQVFGWKLAFICAVVALLVGVLGAILAVTTAS